MLGKPARKEHSSLLGQSYPFSEAQIGTPLGQAPALLTNIGQGSPLTNTTAYFSAASVTEKNSFLVEMRDGMSCKLACLRLPEPSILFVWLREAGAYPKRAPNITTQ
jgi:hypothetical protein